MNCVSSLVVNNKEFLPSCLGGNGRNKALALLGDRLLDLTLYIRLVRLGLTDEGVMTQHRSMVVANANLAVCAERFLVPDALAAQTFNSLSIHEKGTLIEAFLGALFEQQSYIIDDVVHSACEEVVDFLRQSVAGQDQEAGAHRGGSGGMGGLDADGAPAADRPGAASSEFKVKTAMKKSKSALLELLQKRGITQGSSFFSVKAANPLHPNLPPFVSTFEPTFSLACCGLPDTGPIPGDACMTKKEAEESASSKVLLFFREKEKQAMSSTGEPQTEPAAAAQAPAVGEKRNISALAAVLITDSDEIEDGEEVEDEDVINERRQIETKCMMEQIAENKRRAELRRQEYRRPYNKADSASQEQVILGEPTKVIDVESSVPERAPPMTGGTMSGATPRPPAPRPYRGTNEPPRGAVVPRDVDFWPRDPRTSHIVVGSFQGDGYEGSSYLQPRPSLGEYGGGRIDGTAASASGGSQPSITPFNEQPQHHVALSTTYRHVYRGADDTQHYQSAIGGEFYEALARGAEAARNVRARTAPRHGDEEETSRDTFIVRPGSFATSVESRGSAPHFTYTNDQQQPFHRPPRR